MDTGAALDEDEALDTEAGAESLGLGEGTCLTERGVGRGSKESE